MKDTGQIVRRLQVTEKSSGLAAQGQYCFEVDRRANKIEIARAVADLYKVAVAGVRTMNYMGKKKRERTASYGRRSDWKRAVVTLKEGHKIEMA